MTISDELDRTHQALLMLRNSLVALRNRDYEPDFQADAEHEGLGRTAP